MISSIPNPKESSQGGTVGLSSLAAILVLPIMDSWLDSMTLEVFSSLKDSVIQDSVAQGAGRSCHPLQSDAAWEGLPALAQAGK